MSKLGQRVFFLISNFYKQVALTGLICVDDHYSYKQVALTGLICVDDHYSYKQVALTGLLNFDNPSRVAAFCL